ncbi:MAG: hypothetical protein ACREBT_04965 [Thermoplasmata archaeon]
MTVVKSVAEALAATGHAGPEPPFRPVVLAGSSGYFVPIAVFTDEARIDWRGMWIDAHGVGFLGTVSPEAVVPHPPLSPATSGLLNLLSASAVSILERVAELDAALAEVPIGDLRLPPLSIENLHRRALLLRRHVGRLTAIVAELSGPLATPFPDLALVHEEMARQVDRLHAFTQSVEATLRDIVMIRSAAESNRISAIANHLGETSNRIGSLANNSNIRMLGIAYLALVVALVGAALLVPETVSTILSMPSATWVSGYWVVFVLTLSTVVPIVLIFTRPWLVRILRGLGSYEARSQEGLTDLPETTGSGAPVSSSGARHPPSKLGGPK